MITLNVNGVRREVQAADETPLLYVLRNDLQLIGPQFGCGLAQCGACAVLIEGKEMRSCVTPVASVANQEITTLEGLPARWAKQKGLPAEEAKNTLHPVQQAWIEEQTPQCGFCQNGMMIKATELLESNPSPTLTRNQSGLHYFRNVAEFMPLRNLRRDHRRCANMPPRSWRRGAKRWRTIVEKPDYRCVGPTLSRRQFIKAGGILAVGFSVVGPNVLKAETRKAVRNEEFARSDAGEFVDRDSTRTTRY